MTYTTAVVLQALAHGYHYGFDIIDATGLAGGTVYPILRRLDDDGCVRSQWEKEGVARREQRPPRRYYELNARGLTLLAEATTRFRTLESAVPPRRLKPARGTAT
jgi:DNA-binding PadR family transcriptional regulator